VRAHSERHQTAHAVNFLTISDNGEQQEYAGSGSRYVAQHRRARRRWQLSGRQVSADRCCVLVWSGWCGHQVDSRGGKLQLLLRKIADCFGFACALGRFNAPWRLPRQQWPPGTSRQRG
jgi:hypothetical protein